MDFMGFLRPLKGSIIFKFLKTMVVVFEFSVEKVRNDNSLDIWGIDEPFHQKLI